MSDTPRGALYPVLPLRDIVVFPHMIVPLFVGREKSVRALEDVMKEDKQILLLAQKSDVAEELDRLSTHVSEVRRVLKAGGAAGRRLDFLMQELNREANTLGSKAFDPRSTQAAVNLKVLIEQMREQVQNIE